MKPYILSELGTGSFALHSSLTQVPSGERGGESRQEGRRGEGREGRGRRGEERGVNRRERHVAVYMAFAI